MGSWVGIWIMEDQLEKPGTVLRPAAYAAAVWSAIFGAVHLYWLLGGDVGLPEGRSIFDNTALLVIDVVAIPLSLLAAALALSLVRPWGVRYSRRLRLAGAVAAAVLLIVHAVPAIVDWVRLAVGSYPGELSDLARFSLFVYEPWFLAGGILFALAAWGFARHRN